MSVPFNPFNTNIIDEDDQDISFGQEAEEQSTFVAEEVQKPVEKIEKKHNIIDMYWLFNPKLLTKQQIGENELKLITIGYNADFCNLRFCLYDVGNNSKNVFSETAIHKYNATQITTVNVFSEVAEQIITNVTIGKKSTIYNFERIFSKNMIESGWSPSKSTFNISPEDASISINVDSNGTTYTYYFIDWQLKTLLNSMKFMTNGNSWKASLLV